MCARKWRDTWCSINGDVTPGGEKDTFEMAAAYLVRMGGVAVCPPSWFPNLPTTISEHEFAELMKTSPQKIRKMDKTLAKNKGKTDALGKTILCAQGIWMYHEEGKWSAGNIIRTSCSDTCNLCDHHVSFVVG